jgi:hypothetical protein
MLAALVAAPASVVPVSVVPAWASPAADGDVHATYHTYAAGLYVANVKAGFGLGPWSYQVQIAYHTTGLVGFFYRGHQMNTVTGSWDSAQPAPREFFGDGEWRGLHRITLIDYDRGLPLIRSLVPPNETERQKVPPDLQANTVDTLSALAELMRNVASSGRCETTVHTYDGRRVTEIAARTVGTETLAATDRSTFSGRALRCDFEGRMLAGFLLGDSDEAHRRPLHGSAWLAEVVPGTVPMPVRMNFETRWFGDATMYLTKAGQGQLPPQSTH